MGRQLRSSQVQELRGEVRGEGAGNSRAAMRSALAGMSWRLAVGGWRWWASIGKHGFEFVVFLLRAP